MDDICPEGTHFFRVFRALVGVMRGHDGRSLLGGVSYLTGYIILRPAPPLIT